MKNNKYSINMSKEKNENTTNECLKLNTVHLFHSFSVRIGGWVKNSLAKKLAEKQSEHYSVVIPWLRIRISFVILRSVILCVRGSRTPFRVRDEHLGDDLRLNNIECDL